MKSDKQDNIPVYLCDLTREERQLIVDYRIADKTGKKKLRQKLDIVDNKKLHSNAKRKTK